MSVSKVDANTYKVPVPPCDMRTSLYLQPTANHSIYILDSRYSIHIVVIVLYSVGITASQLNVEGINGVK